MPSGNVHNAATMMCAIGSAGTLLFISGDIKSSVGVGLGSLIALAVHCDLDLDGNKLISTASLQYLLDHPLAWFWKLIWKPYAVVARHRSPTSHMPILSTTIRLAYLLAITSPIWLYYHWGLPSLSVPRLWMLFGLFLADAIHALLDTIDAMMGGAL